MGNTGSLKKEAIARHYKVGKTLGKGAYAVVKKVTHKESGQNFACKIIKSALSTKDQLAIQNEVDVMLKIDHPHCVRLYEIFDSGDKLFLVMELIEGGELYDCIANGLGFSEKVAATVIGQIAEALVYLHHQGIVHRDLKPENVLAVGKTYDNVKLTDFGVAKALKDPHEKMHSACGTPSYVAPEILMRKPFTAKVDIWSLGVMLYVLLCGYQPFDGAGSSQKLYAAIKAGKVTFPATEWKTVSPEAIDLVKSCLQVDPEKRLSAQQVLEHKWVREKAPNASPNVSQDIINNFRVMQARRYLKRAVLRLILAHRFRDTFNAILEDKEIQVGSPIPSDVTADKACNLFHKRPGIVWQGMKCRVCQKPFREHT